MNTSDDDGSSATTIRLCQRVSAGPTVKIGHVGSDGRVLTAESERSRYRCAERFGAWDGGCAASGAGLWRDVAAIGQFIPPGR